MLKKILAHFLNAPDNIWLTYGKALMEVVLCEQARQSTLEEFTRSSKYNGYKCAHGRRDTVHSQVVNAQT